MLAKRLREVRKDAEFTKKTTSTERARERE
jgi:hypothetical protein